MNSQLDCDYLLNKLGFIVPRSGSRNSRYFYVPFVSTNTGYNSPVHRISTVFNKYRHCTDFTDSLPLFKSRIIQEMKAIKLLASPGIVMLPMQLNYCFRC